MITNLRMELFETLVETVNCNCDYVKIMSVVLRTDKLSIGALSFSQCRCGGARWVRPLQLRTTHGRTRLATGLRPGWEPSKHASNTLVDLGPFSVPVFLIKGILTGTGKCFLILSSTL